MNKHTGPVPNDVIGVELFQRDNAKEHHTYKYELLEKNNPALVIRRGDPFYLAIQLRNVYDQDNNKIRLEFLFGKFFLFDFPLPPFIHSSHFNVSKQTERKVNNLTLFILVKTHLFFPH